MPEKIVCHWCRKEFFKRTDKVLGSNQEKHFCSTACYQLHKENEPYTKTQEQLLKAIYLLGSKSVRFYTELFERDPKTILTAAKRLQEQGNVSISQTGSKSSTLSITDKGEKWVYLYTEVDKQKLLFSLIME